MAEKLNLKLAPKELASYRFQSGEEALEVIDIVRGRHVARAAEAILYDGKTSGYMRIAPLSDEEIGRVKEILLSRDDRMILSGLRTCLARAKLQAKADALWELAMDERPWLWWYAIEKLANWGEFEGKYDSLPDNLKVRLFAVMGPEGFSDTEQIAPRANELLAEIVTPKLVELDSPTVFKIIEKIAANPDRRFATTALINYLWRFDGLYLSPAYPVGKTVKYINLWYGLDIGGLGSDMNQRIGDPNEHDWPKIVAEAVAWYDSEYGSSDADIAE